MPVRVLQCSTRLLINKLLAVCHCSRLRKHFLKNTYQAEKDCLSETVKVLLIFRLSEEG